MEQLMPDVNSSYYDDNHNYFDEKREPITVLFVRGLTASMTFLTLQNLFRRIAEPVYIHLDRGKKYAHVKFETLREAEMARRVYHQAPPHNLLIDFSKPNNTKAKMAPIEDCPDILLPLKHFNLDPIAPQVISAGRGRKLLNRDNLAGEVLDPLLAPPIPGMQVLLSQQMVFGNRAVTYGRGHYIPSRNRKEYYSPHTVDLKAVHKSKPPEMLECTHCKEFTRQRCKGCSKSFCSFKCLRGSSTHAAECERFGEL